MKTCFLPILIACILFTGCNNSPSEKAVADAPRAVVKTPKNRYLDVHELEPGKVTFDDVMGAHQKDLATQDKYGVRFLKFWVDEAHGKVYCLSEANDSTDVINTHREAHGLLPSIVMQVKEGE